VWGRTPPIRTIPAQTQLFMQGSPADEAYLLLTGRIQLRRDGPLRRLVLETLERGEFLAIGELLHHRPYAATAVALEPSSAIAVSRELFDALVATSSPLVLRALSGATRQVLTLIESYEAQALDQTFLGLCRGLELILSQAGPLPESQLVARLRELFSLPAASVSEALKLLDGLNLIKRRQEPGREAIIQLAEGVNFSERVRSFSEQWRGKLPALLGGGPPKEALKLEELCALLEVKPDQLMRRMVMPDFPTGLLRFDPEGVEVFRKTHGDGFFKKRVSGRELLAQIQSVEQLREVEVAMLRDILPRMEVPRLIRLMSGLDGALREHLLQALSSRVRKTVEHELEFVSGIGARELADLEDELLRLCRSA
jgi:hypothetical protein